MKWTARNATANYRPRPQDASPQQLLQRLRVCESCSHRRSNRCRISQEILTVAARRSVASCELWPGYLPPISKEPAASSNSRIVNVTTKLPRGPRPHYECDVLIPYYKQLKWLPATVEAIAGQTDIVAHIHLINDCSPEDDTAARRDLAHLPRLHWYQNRHNIGPYRSYHNVWGQLRTSTVAIQDADDFPLPHRLWRACHALATHRADIYGAAMEQAVDATVPADDPVRSYAERQPILSTGPAGKLYPSGILINGTMVVRRAAIERINGFADAHCGADTEFITRAHAAGLRFVHDSAVVAVRRVHPTSLSRGGPHGIGSASRNQRIAEWLERYALYDAAGPGFDFRRFGALDQARPEETVEREPRDD